MREWGDWGEKEGDRPRCSRSVLGGRRRVTLAEMTSSSESALAAAVAGAAIGTLSLSPVNPTPARLVHRQSSVRPSPSYAAAVDHTAPHLLCLLRLFFFFLMPPVEPLTPSARCIEMFSSPAMASSPSSPSTSCAALVALPLLDAVGALAALDAALALMPSSSLAAAAAHVVADTHDTLYKHISVLLSFCVTRERLRLCAHVAHHHVMLVARRHRAHALIISSRLARLADELVVHLEPVRCPDLT